MSHVEPPSVREPQPGQSFGRYELLGKIGDGGMATVWRAAVRGPGRAARRVALKLIHASLCRQEPFVEMFLNEMRVAMALQHRNVVQTFDAGQVDGRHYLAMELVNGCSVADLLRETPAQPLPIDVVLFIGMEVCGALAYAHSFRPELRGQPGGVIHRDVSPGNILLTRHGDVKLADFGVARMRNAIVASSPNLVKGKFAYMAREQALSLAEPRSDLFSLGVVLFELLTKQPYRAGAGLGEVLAPEAEPATLAQLRPDVPPRLEQTVRSCLATELQQRPISAEALRESLAQELFQLHLEHGRSTDGHARVAAIVEQVASSVRISWPQPSDVVDTLHSRPRADDTIADEHLTDTLRDEER